MTAPAAPLVVELLGPAGAGKSTILGHLARRDASIRTDMGVWTLPRSLLLVGATQRLTTIAGLFRAARAPLWEEAKYVIKLRALTHQLRWQRRSRWSTIVFEEGPVFGLCWLRAEAHPVAADGGLASWWPGALRDCAAAVDVVAFIDAPNPILAHRVRSRNHSHPLKSSPDHVLFAFFDRLRAASARTLAELRAANGPTVVTFDSAERDPLAIAEDLLARFAGARNGA